MVNAQALKRIGLSHAGCCLEKGCLENAFLCQRFGFYVFTKIERKVGSANADHSLYSLQIIEECFGLYPETMLPGSTTSRLLLQTFFLQSEAVSLAKILSCPFVMFFQVSSSFLPFFSRGLLHYFDRSPNVPRSRVSLYDRLFPFCSAWMHEPCDRGWIMTTGNNECATIN